ncbi:MAG: hypothetical protein AAGB12_09180 [Pseudomonadota bacterium]
MYPALLIAAILHPSQALTYTNPLSTMAFVPDSPPEQTNCGGCHGAPSGVDS